ncbi:DMT family transporter [Zooshikella sp. RANM57]|uniref:DMT family transporter n=1 Tax=Zooshikella sp. RANM57 TaxID=3425863 RepID=UPI003D6DC215
MTYIHLAIAVIAEVIGTSALKAAEGFSKPIPSLIVIIGYSVAFYFLSLTLRTLPVGITYAVWSGLGVIFIMLAGMILYKQLPDLPAILGMVMITSGVIIIQLFSKTVSH